jgi:NAD(P) transhydrogenase subunit alpha
MSRDLILAIYVFILATFVGFEVIARVPAILHTPLMSATNAIHGIVLLGAMLVAGYADTPLLQGLAFVAVILGAANVFGGFAVTERMLDMFKQQQPNAPDKSGPA